jgi:hypothetical protein
MNDKDAEGSFLGLGYYHSATTQPSAQPETSDLAVDAANKLMQQYLQQCLEYHHEQEDHRRNEQAVPIVDTELQFVPAVAAAATGESNVVETSMEAPDDVSDVSIDMKAPDLSIDPMTQPQSQSQQSTNDDPSLMHNQQVQEGRLRVQEILKRFHQQQEQFLQSRSSLPPTNDIDGISTDIDDGTPTTTATFIPDTSTIPSLYQQQRITAFQREAVRKHAALLKNLEYVAAQQDRRLHQLTAQAEQSRLDQVRMQEHHRAVLEERKRARQPQQQVGGIETKQRKMGEHYKRAKGYPRTDTTGTDTNTNTNTNTDDHQSSVAIYLSGLETDGSSFAGGGGTGRDEEQQQQQDSARGLFSSYGKIAKVHVYRNKRTGGLKGDALVVFQVSCQAEGDALAQMVCSQVSRLACACCCCMFVVDGILYSRVRWNRSAESQ